MSTSERPAPRRGDVWSTNAGVRVLVVSSTVYNEILSEPTVVIVPIFDSEPDAGFGVPAAKLGLMVDQWTVRRLAALAGQSTARHVLLSTDVLSGERAHSVGLVHRLGTTEDGLAWADRIAELAPLAPRIATWADRG